MLDALHVQQELCTTFQFLKKTCFFPSNISEWNISDHSLYNSESFLTFKTNILQFLRTAGNSVCNCHNPRGIKLFRRFRLGLSYLRVQNFKLNFPESLCPLRNCGHGIESITPFSCPQPFFTNERFPLRSIWNSIDCNMLKNTNFVLTQKLLFGNLPFNSNKNRKILIATIDYILWTKRFDEVLF